MGYGFSCFNCRAQFDVENADAAVAADRDEAENAAGREGWCMGLDADGQAHNACPDCAEILFNVRPLGLSTYRKPAAAAAD